MLSHLIAKNRKALHDHELLEKFTAGIVLKGYEVKAIKEGKANLDGSYVIILDGEPFVVNMHVGRYSNQSAPFSEVDARRNRKLLLNRKEIEHLKKETDQKGKTAVPLAVVLQNNQIKIEFGIMRGRKDYEKKVVVKERQLKRELEKQAKELKF